MIFQKPDIITVIQNEGVHLIPKGKSLFALCPFHAERKASFQVSPERQFFYCFGCHEHGDVIHFIQKYRDLSFKEALRYLGISTGRPTPEAIKKIEQEKYRRELVKAFKTWCYEHHDNLCSFIRTLWKAKQQVKDEAGLNRLIPYYHAESLWLYQIEILLGNDEAKLELYREVIYES